MEFDNQSQLPETVEFFHHFHIGAEREGVQHLIDQFENKHSGIEIEEKTPSGPSHSLEVKTKILGEQSVDAWDIPIGSVAPYYESGVLLDLTEVWEETNLGSRVPQMAHSTLQFENEFVSIPMDVYRSNNLFYNKELAREIDIDPDRLDSLSKFVAVLEMIEDEHEYTGLSLHFRNPFGLLQLWSVVLLAQEGPRRFRKIVSGDVVSEEAVRKSLKTVEHLFSIGNDDAKFRSTVDSANRLIENKVVFVHDGDWALGTYDSATDFEFGTDWDVVPFPGTSGTYQMGMNTFAANGLRKKTEPMKEFLRFAASPEGQTAFAKQKGSLPAREDVSLDSYHPYLQRQYDLFQRSRFQVPAIAHESGIRPDHLIDLKSLVPTLLTDWDIRAMSRKIRDILQ